MDAMRTTGGQRRDGRGNALEGQEASGRWRSRGRAPIASRGATAEVAEDSQVRRWRPFPRPGLDLLCEEVCAREIRVHAYEEVEICVPLTPVRVIDGLGRGELARPGSIVLLNPGDLHGALAANGDRWNALVLLVAADTIAEIRAEYGGEEGRDALRTLTTWFPRRVVADEEMAAEIRTLFDELRRPPASLGCQSRVMDCLARLVARHAVTREFHPSPNGTRYGVSRVRDYLLTHVAEPACLDQLARVALLSKFYLLRAFVAEYGISPHAYQMELRLARARTLLAQGTPLSYAAYEAGFADQSHLTRRMRGAFGFTPGAFARQCAAPTSSPSGDGNADA